MDNLKGALLMIAAMAGFAVEDMLLKIASQSISVGQILIQFGAGGAMMFALLVRMRGKRVFDPLMLHRTVLLRALSEMTGRLFYTLALALTPLSSASVILQATPLVVVAGAAILFGERVGWRRWSAILVGFVGVLLILRPGTSGFDALSLLAVIGMLGFAGRDLATRAAPRGLSNAQLGVYGFAILVPIGGAHLAWTGGAVVPDARVTVVLVLAILVGVAAYSCITAAMRVGEVSVVTPFRYTRLVFALILGALAFAERPDPLTYIGGAIIVASGVYALLRGRRQSDPGRNRAKVVSTVE